MHYLLPGVILVAFWLMLSGYFTPLLLSLGALSIVAVLLIQRRMDQIDGVIADPLKDHAQHSLWATAHYLVWLVKQVVLANYTVARMIWSRQTPLHPHWEAIPVTLKSPVSRTLYAHSITLTPGTLTTAVHKDHFLVHSLSREGLEDLRKGEMQARISRIAP